MASGSETRRDGACGSETRKLRRSATHRTFIPPLAVFHRTARMAQNFEAAVVTQGFTDMNPSQTNTGKARIPDSVLTR